MSRVVKHAAIIFLMLAVVSTNPARSQEQIDAAVLDFFPFGYNGADGGPAGLSVTIFQAIADELGFELHAHLLPVARALSATTRGETDILYSYRDPIMVGGVDFLGNVGCLTSMIVPRKGLEIHGLDDLEGLRVGFVLGGYFAIRYVPDHKMIPIGLPNNQTMLRMLARGRVDAIVLNDAVLFAYRHRIHDEARLPEDWAQHIGIPFILKTLETHISLSRASDLYPHAARIAQAIRKVRRDGTVSRAYKDYGMSHGGSCDPVEIRRAIFGSF